MSCQLVTLPLDKLHALRRNPQYLSEKQQRALEDSIRRDGFLVPIIVRHRQDADSYEILSGNHRTIAARNVDGAMQIPCVLKDPCSDDEAARIAVNMNTVHGDPNVELLAPFLAEMSDAALGQLYIAEDMVMQIKSFDLTLKARLDALEVPDAMNSNSLSGRTPNCICKRCGHRHVAAHKTSRSTPAARKNTGASKRS